MAPPPPSYNAVDNSPRLTGPRSQYFSQAEVLLSRLIIQDLKTILKREGLALGGNKQTLYNRVRDQLQRYVVDDTSFDRLYGYILNPRGKVADIPNQSSLSLTAPRLPTSSHLMARGNSNTLRFVDSPFFIKKSVLTTFRLPACQTNRHEVSGTIPFSPPELEGLRNNPQLRVFVYCGEMHPAAGPNGTNIKFPSQLEVRVNNEEIKANYKGIGKKEGSVKPVDVTPFIRRSPNQAQANQFKITYALTTKVMIGQNATVYRECKKCKSLTQAFQIVVMLVEKIPLETLVNQISLRTMSKESVLKELRSKAQDADIEIGPITMSLKDAASQVRITVPCRGIGCKHQSCFDASTYLQMQEQAPLWSCPICDKQVSFLNLAVDRYFEDILQNTPRSVDSVIIQPDGTWSVDPTAQGGSDSDSDNDSDDIIEVSAPRALSSTVGGGTPRSYSTVTPNSIISTKATGSRPSVATGSKRQSEVIDLTLSDDETSEPPPKRSNTGPRQLSQQPNVHGFRIPSSLGQSRSSSTSSNVPPPFFSNVNTAPQPNTTSGFSASMPSMSAITGGFTNRLSNWTNHNPPPSLPSFQPQASNGLSGYRNWNSSSSEHITYGGSSPAYNTGSNNNNRAP